VPATAQLPVAIGRSVVALNETICGALTMSGNAKLDVDGNIIVRSRCSTSAIAASGYAHLEAAKIYVVGKAQTGGNVVYSPVPLPPPANWDLSDPLASLAAPNVAALTSRGSINCSNGAQTLAPGRYGSVKASGHCVLTMNPGVYALETNGLQISGNASLTGSGVFIYNVSGDINLSGNGSFNLSPPVAGEAFAGVLLFQSRSNTKALSFSGNASGIRGTVYAPAAQVTMSGNGTAKLSLLANTIRMSGNAANALTAGAQSSNVDAAAIMGAGQLRTGALWVSIDQSAVVVDPEQISRIRDSIQTINETFGPYGVSLIEVDGASSDMADIRIIVDTTSACGGQDDGILGCTTAWGDITLIQGWDWFAGQEAGAIAASQFDYQTIVTHELGHAVGVEHSGNSNSTMFSHLTTGVARRIFTTHDLALLAEVHADEDLEHDALMSALRVPWQRGLIGQPLPVVHVDQRRQLSANQNVVDDYFAHEHQLDALRPKSSALKTQLVTSKSPDVFPATTKSSQDPRPAQQRQKNSSGDSIGGEDLVHEHDNGLLAVIDEWE
jgi:hypothetical protein